MNEWYLLLSLLSRIYENLLSLSYPYNTPPMNRKERAPFISFQPNTPKGSTPTAITKTKLNKTKLEYLHHIGHTQISTSEFLMPSFDSSIHPSTYEQKWTYVSK